MEQYDYEVVTAFSLYSKVKTSAIFLGAGDEIPNRREQLGIKLSL